MGMSSILINTFNFTEFSFFRYIFIFSCFIFLWNLFYFFIFTQVATSQFHLHIFFLNEVKSVKKHFYVPCLSSRHLVFLQCKLLKFQLKLNLKYKINDQWFSFYKFFLSIMFVTFYWMQIECLVSYFTPLHYFGQCTESLWTFTFFKFKIFRHSINVEPFRNK